MKQLIIFIFAIPAALLSSCGLSENKVLDILNNGEAIPATYKNMTILDSKAGYWIGNTDQFNHGGKWTKIRTDEDITKTHNLTIPAVNNIAPNSKLIDQNGKSVYVHNRYGCRGCNYCYQRLKESEIVEYRIVKGELDTSENLRIATALTPKGKELQLITEETKLFQDTESQIFIKVAEYVFTKVISMTQEGKSATATVEYYIDYTPYSEALGKEDTPKSIAEFQFKKESEGWVVEM
ncbi:MAG: hypothetical protein SNH35_01495 [Rikenellaceae bacterium]